MTIETFENPPADGEAQVWFSAEPEKTITVTGSGGTWLLDLPDGIKGRIEYDGGIEQYRVMIQIPNGPFSSSTQPGDWVTTITRLAS